MDASSNFVSLHTIGEKRRITYLNSELFYLRLYVCTTCTLYVYVCLVVQFSRVGLAISMYASNKESDGQVGEEGGGTGADEQSFSPIRQSDLYPHNSKVVGKHSVLTNLVDFVVLWKRQIFRGSS